MGVMITGYSERKANCYDDACSFEVGKYAKPENDFNLPVAIFNLPYKPFCIFLCVQVCVIARDILPIVSHSTSVTEFSLLSFLYLSLQSLNHSVPAWWPNG